MRTRPAFSYLELAVVATVIGIFLIVAIPDEDGATKEQGRQFCQKFEADAAYARSLTIAVPNDPVVIKVDGPNNRYWLARASDPDTPITHPWTGEPYVVECGPEGDEGLEYVVIAGISFEGDNILSFDAMGSTDQETSALIQVTAGDARFELAVAPVAANSTINCGYSQDLSNVPGSMKYGPGSPPSPPPPGDPEGAGAQSPASQGAGS